MRSLLIFFVAAIAAFAQQTVYYPPAELLAAWTPGVTVGVQGGIPAYDDTNKYIDVTSYGADPTGVADSVTAIRQAVAAAKAAVAADGTYRVVYFPAGTYRVSGTVNLDYSHHHIVLRGAGPSLTRINADASANGTIFGLGNNSIDFKNHAILTATVTAVDASRSVLTLNSATGFQVGQVCRIYFDKAALLPDVPIFSVNGLGTSTTSPFRYCPAISAVSGNQITVSPPIPFDVPSGTITVATPGTNVNMRPANMLGVEGMYLDGGRGEGRTIQLTGIRNAWTKNVKFVNHGSKALYTINAVYVEIRHCEVGLSSGGYTAGKSGIITETTTAMLMEDNIVYGNQPGLEINSGTCGCAILYNYFVLGGRSLNIDTNHNAHNRTNLYEGNVSPNLMCDGYWGTTSHDVIFRNWFTGVNDPSAPVNGYCIALKRGTRKYALIGNVLQSPGATNDPYSFGQPYMGNPWDNGVTVSPINGTWWFDWNTGDQAWNSDAVKWWDAVCNTVQQVRGGDDRMHSQGTATVSAEQIADFGAHLVKCLEPAAKFSTSTQSQYWQISAFNPTTGTFSFYSVSSDPDTKAGQAFKMYPSALGWGEFDADVLPTTLRKANRTVFAGGIPASEALGPNEILPDSLAYTGTPSWWPTGMAWPPIDPYNPTYDREAIPAGYRYVHGTDPGGEPPPTPPATPTNVHATAVSHAQVNVTWQDNSSDETGFRIYRTLAGPVSLLAAVGPGVTSYSDPTVSPSTQYFYSVAAVKGSIIGTQSAQATVTTPAAPTQEPTIPAAPTALFATATSPTQVNLQWTDNASDETGFRVSRRLVGGTFSTIGTTDANVTTFSDTTASQLTTYEYSVLAFNAAGNSAASNTASATTPEEPVEPEPEPGDVPTMRSARVPLFPVRGN